MLVNTVDADIPGGDHIATLAAFRTWCERLGLSAGRHTLAEVHGVRARIDAVLRPLATGDTPPPAALAALRELILSDRHHRLRRCANCTWLFLDLSRNHSRKWCSMEHCGTQVKIRRLSERRRSNR